MIRMLSQHLWAFLRHPVRYLRTMRQNRRITRLRTTINAHQDNAVLSLPKNLKGPRFENFATQTGTNRSFEAMITDLEAMAAELGLD